MYGDKGPPKGYSVPRYDTTTTRYCQLCTSADHWTFECPTKASAGTPAGKAARKSNTTTVKLSRSQMLKYGVKPKVAAFVPEPTEREVFDSEMKELRTVLTAEVRSELKGSKGSKPVADPTMAPPAKAAPKVMVKDEAAVEPVAVKKERSEERE